MKKFNVELFVTEDTRHSAYLIAGLLKLEKQGVIDLNFKSMPFLIKNRWILDAEGYRSKSGYPWCPEIVVRKNDSGESKRIGIDLQDWTHFFSFHAINNCDLIFKRAYDPLLENEYKAKVPTKILPLGPNHSCSIDDSRVLKKIGLSKKKQMLSKAFSEPSKIKKALHNKLRKGSQWTTSFKDETAFPNPPKNDYVFFQVECHTWKSNSLASGLNEFRADLIKKLRAELGSKFVGGMFFRGAINPKFADCLTNVNPDPANYRKFVENAAVVISSNGFGNSIPWKLTEYMKWGCCIVTERNKHAFRQPIIENTLNEFVFPDQCVEICLELLTNVKKRTEQRKLSQKYYDEHIAPERSVLHILNTAFL